LIFNTLGLIKNSEVQKRYKFLFFNKILFGEVFISPNISLFKIIAFLAYCADILLVIAVRIYDK